MFPSKELVGAAMLLGSAMMAAASPIYNVQFSTGPAQTGAAVIGSAGDVWNQFPGGAYAEFTGGTLATPTALQDTTGNVSGIDITYSDDGVYSLPPQFANGFNGTPWQSLMGGILYGLNVDLGTVTLTGLTPDSAYQMYLYTQADSAAEGRVLSVTVNGLTATSAPGSAAANSFIFGQNYLSLAPVADASGTIVIQFSGVAGQGVVKAGEGDFNGFQLTAVPEPSTWKGGAFVLALLAIHLGRRRLKHA
jgi:hypothetical protein